MTPNKNNSENHSFLNMALAYIEVGKAAVNQGVSHLDL